EEALRQDNDSVDAWIYLGLAKAKLGKLDEAEAHARKALTLEPDHTLGRRFLITFLKDQGKIDAAIEQCEELLRLQKESAVAHCQLGLFLTHKGRLEEARGHLQRAIQLRPDYAEAYYNLCAVCTKEGDRRGARRNLELAIRAKPDYAEALNSLGVLVYGETGNLDEAERYARRALEADPAYFQAHENLGIVLEKRGRWEEAIQHYNLALKGHESSPRTLTLLAWILATCPEDSLRNGRFAVNLAEKACDATGRRDSKPLDVLAAACAEVGDFDRAAHAARAALSALPADPRQLEARDAIEARLELYLERRPYRQPRP
ncbi:MAG: tetratricopeptide repeat protein, partial [Planctomycetes bacterium]|nr:tetratricopeptide repeat protein [Planctomycetota bacterium]